MEHSVPFKFDNVNSNDYMYMLYGDNIPELKPLPATTTGIIPPPFEPKGYAAVVKQGKTLPKQSPAPTSTSTSQNNNNNTKKNNKPKDKKGKDLSWEFHPAHSSSAKPKTPTKTKSPVKRNKKHQNKANPTVNTDTSSSNVYII